MLDALLALLGAEVLAACARGLLHLRPVARSPVVVIELLTAVVSFSLGFQAGLIQYGGPLMLTAVVVLYLLFTLRCARSWIGTTTDRRRTPRQRAAKLGEASS